MVVRLGKGGGAHAGEEEGGDAPDITLHKRGNEGEGCYEGIEASSMDSMVVLEANPDGRSGSADAADGATGSRGAHAPLCLSLSLLFGGGKKRGEMGMAEKLLMARVILLADQR